MLNRAVRELEDEIRASELRVIDCDSRLQLDMRRLRRDASQAIGARVAAAVGLLAAGFLLRRPSRALQRRYALQRPRRRGLLAGLTPLLLRRGLPLLVPMLTPLLGRRSIQALGKLGLPVGAVRAAAPLRTAPALDLARYAGLWYEIARLPRRFERRCASDTLVHYSVDRDGLIVVGRCTGHDGGVHESAGRIRSPNAEAPAELEVTYAPQWLRWWPGTWSDYWVIYVDAEYTCALVGTPERDGLWVLARDPTLPDSALQALLTLASRLGFDTTQVRLTPQNA